MGRCTVPTYDSATREAGARRKAAATGRGVLSRVVRGQVQGPPYLHGLGRARRDQHLARQLGANRQSPEPDDWSAAHGGGKGAVSWEPNGATFVEPIPSAARSSNRSANVGEVLLAGRSRSSLLQGVDRELLLGFQRIRTDGARRQGRIRGRGAAPGVPPPGGGGAGVCVTQAISTTPPLPRARGGVRG